MSYNDLVHCYLDTITAGNPIYENPCNKRVIKVDDCDYDIELCGTVTHIHIEEKIEDGKNHIVLINRDTSKVLLNLETNI